MATEQEPLAEKIERLEQSALFLIDLASYIHEHGDMLFRLADNLKAESEKLRRQGAGEQLNFPRHCEGESPRR